MKGKPRHRKEKVKYQHAHHRSQQAAQMAGSDHRDHQYCQKIRNDDIRFCKAQSIKCICQQRSCQKHQYTFSHIPYGESHIPRQPFFHTGIIVSCGGIRDDVYIQIWGIGDQPVRQRRFAKQMVAAQGASSDNHLGHAGQSGIFRDLIGNILAVHGFYGSPQLFSQPHIIPKTLFIRLIHRRCPGSFHKQRSEIAMKSCSHSGCRPNDPGIGR